MTDKPDVLMGGGGVTSAGWHKIEAALRCPKEYQLKHVRGVHIPVSQTPDYFAIGILFHAGRAAWFVSRFDPNAWDVVQAAIYKAAEEAPLPMSQRVIKQALALMQEYMRHWGMRPKPDPIACEYLLGPAPLQAGDPLEWFRTARIDDVSHYPMGGRTALCIGEAKTTSGSVSDVVKLYTMHGQPMLQVLLWKMAPQGEKTYGPVAGVMLDVAVKPLGGKIAAFERVFIPVTEYSLKWYVRSMRHYIRQAAGILWDTDVPRNITACTRKAGAATLACEYQPLCQHGRSASTNYVLPGGKSLLSHVPSAGQEKMPWE